MLLLVFPVSKHKDVRGHVWPDIKLSSSCDKAVGQDTPRSPFVLLQRHAAVVHSRQWLVVSFDQAHR